MDPGERTTGETRDEHFDLVSVLYHALRGADACGRYASDAEAAGDERLAAFFREAQGMQTVIAERAKGMLGIGGASRREVFDVPPEGMVDDTVVDDVPPATDVPRSPADPPPPDGVR